MKVPGLHYAGGLAIERVFSNFRKPKEKLIWSVEEFEEFEEEPL